MRNVRDLADHMRLKIIEQLLKRNLLTDQDLKAVNCRAVIEIIYIWN